MSNHSITVSMLVHHGDYREEFLGSGATIEEAAMSASWKSTYSMDLYNVSDSRYAVRQKYRDELVEKLGNGEDYRGFGWMTYKVV